MVQVSVSDSKVTAKEKMEGEAYQANTWLVLAKMVLTETQHKLVRHVFTTCVIGNSVFAVFLWHLIL